MHGEDYHLDIAELAHAESDNTPSSGDRPWVGIEFACCHVYTRVYRNAVGSSYVGRCPKCGRSVSLRVGADGTSARFFVAE